MAEDSQDDSQKTEEPTQKRLQDAFKKGQVPSSREVNNFFFLFVFALIIGAIIPGMMSETRLYFSHFITSPHDIEISVGNLSHLFVEIGFSAAIVMGIPLMLTIVAALLSGFIQHGWLVSFEPLKPKLEKISVFKGMKRLFSMKSMMEFLKGLVKITVIGLIVYWVVDPYAGFLKSLPNTSIIEGLKLLSSLAIKILIGACSFMAFVALLDFLYQNFEYRKQMRMSLRDIKDEHKQQEGDPQVKGKIRAIRMERARQRMMANVPDADVVITNPTHYSVALKYDMDNMRAPVLVGKGQDNLALKIREIAKENDIPIVENPPLARALYAAMELDDEIPMEHYQAVAEVISYVYRLKGKIPNRPAEPEPTKH